MIDRTTARPLRADIAISSPTTPPRRWRPATVAVVLATGLLGTLAGCSERAGAQGGPPGAPPVSVAPAVQRQVADSEEFSGRLEASEFVELRPRVAGTIDTVHFADGAMVAKGQLLFTIDPRPFEAALAQAQAQVTATKARAELAETQLKRANTLVEQQAVSRQEVDQFNSGARTSRADIEGAEAAVRVARLDLEYARVRAPIAGRVSRAAVTAGNLVNEQSVLTTIAGVKRLYAYFDGSEQSFLRLRSNPEGKPPVVLLGLANEDGFPHRGSVDFIDNRLNPQTGAIRMRASFDNSAGLFTPGLAARLRMDSGVPRPAVLVPDRAIGTDQTKKYVYVVAGDGKPQFREIKLGPVHDGMRVVTGALKAGELVVVDGLQRIQPGMTVQPQVLQVDARGMPIFPPPPPPPGAAPAASGAARAASGARPAASAAKG